MTKKRVDEKNVVGKLLVEKHGDFLCQVIKDALTRLMDAEVEERCGAALRERTGERVNRRNGYRERLLETRMGTVDLAWIPTDRSPSNAWGAEPRMFPGGVRVSA